MEEKLYLVTEVGALKITASDKGITGICFTDEEVPEVVPAVRNFHLLVAQMQLMEYFEKERTEFELQLDVHGTEFQEKVWEELKKIPYGEVRSYQDIAAAIGNPKAARAVGMANNRNPICIVVPCHRVVGKDKKLTGYAGGIDKKEYLLKLESGE